MVESQRSGTQRAHDLPSIFQRMMVPNYTEACACKQLAYYHVELNRQLNENSLSVCHGGATDNIRQ